MNAIIELPPFRRLLLAVLIATAVSFCTTPLVKKAAQKMGAMDIPKDGRRMHDHPIPRMGGLAVAIAFLLTVMLTVRLDRQLQGILLGSILILVLGVLDDCLSLKALPKFLVQIAAACIVVRHGCTIEYVTNPLQTNGALWLDLGIFSGPLTVLWIVTITNAVNFIDGLDGLAVGVSAIATTFMLVIAIQVSEIPVAVILACLLGACLGFIPYNFNPAQIFMGDTGSTFLGFLLASLSIKGLFKLYAAISFAVPFLILGLPFADITFAVIRRICKGQNPMTADRGHIHHRLIDMGFSQKQTVVIAYMLTGVLGTAAVLLTKSTSVKAMIVLGAVLIVALLAFVVIFGPHHRPDHKDKS